MSTATSTPTATDTWRPTNWEAEETPKDRLFRKLKEQPVVPAGVLLTCAALGLASYHLRKGNQVQMNKALRWRVYFQGITVVAAVGGLLYIDKQKDTTDGSGTTAASSSSTTTTTPAPSTLSSPPDDLRAKLKQATSRQEWIDLYRSATRTSTSTARDDSEVIKAKEQHEIEEDRKFEEALLRGVEERREIIEQRRRNRPLVGQDGRDRTNTTPA